MMTETAIRRSCRVRCRWVPLRTATGTSRRPRSVMEGRSTMEALWPHQSGDVDVNREQVEPPGDVRTLLEIELDRRIRAGWDVWCELLDDLLSTGGMLPSRELAGRVVAFFEDAYWRAEDARVEALRRQMAANGRRRCRVSGRSRGIR